jgi:import inner membrane translocase subunit TIM21
MPPTLLSPDPLLHRALQLSSRHLRPTKIANTPSIPHLPRTTAFHTSAHFKATSPSSSSSSSSRKHVTVINDDGRVRWSDLSVGEKAARTTQQSFNFVVVIAGVVLTGAVAALLYSEVFSPDSKTSHFNRAVDEIRRSPQITALLGPGNKISAHGEASWSRWARNRYISSTTEVDKYGTSHLHFKFYVEGPLNQGVVYAHMTKKPSESDYSYYTLAVDVKGHQRIYLENAEDKKGRGPVKVFGLRWS